MFIIYGARTYGTVDCEDGSQHATRFAHVYYLPLFPVGGVRFARGHEEPAPIDGKSVLLAYARVWGFVAAMALAANAYLQLEKSLVSGAIWTVLAGAALMASLAAWFWMGVRRPNSPLALGLGFGVPLVALLVVVVAGVQENTRRKRFDDLYAKSTPSSELLALARAEAAKEKQAALEKKQARCEAGEGAMCNDLGYALAKTDRAASLAAYQKGCDADSGMACFNLGLVLGKTEPTRSTPLYERSCELGFGDGCNNLGTSLEKSDRRRAVALFDKACSLKSDHGCRNLARLQDPARGAKKVKSKRG